MSGQQMPLDGQLPVPLDNRLRALSPEELQEVLENDEKMERLVLDSEEVQNLQLEREMSLATNRSLAESNLGLQPRLERGKAQLLEKYGELRQIHQAVTERHQKLESHRQRADPEGLLAVLQAEGAKVEDESEELAEAFLSGQCVLDAFLERYAEQRRLAHARRVRVEKLQEILQRRDPPSSSSSSTPPPPQEGSSQPRRQPPPRPPHPAPRPPSGLPYDPNPSEPGRAQDPRAAPYPLGPPQGAPSYPAPGPGGSPSFSRGAPSYPAPSPGGSPSFGRGAPSYPAPSYPQDAPSYPAPSYPPGAPSYPAPNPRGPPTFCPVPPACPAPAPRGDPSRPQPAPPYPAPQPPPSPHFRPQGPAPPYPLLGHQLPYSAVPYGYHPPGTPPGMPYPQPRPY